MKFTVTRFIVGLAIANAFVLATCQSYSCSGSILCRGLAQSDCDAAERQIQPGNSYFTGGSAGSTGVCSGHCGLFVSGSFCQLSGTDMNNAFNELRAHDCAKCGIKTFENGCQFKADYVSGS
ncbi:unnamed protein product [Sphagnum jensenii]|uniref:Uncharacterized protein n=2 Tax=Sphagnum jensenii TaxID=128206 RepID=A0ABP1A1B3_9BRYO